eukprot:13777684-Alexandrium_andersonii.AAC.1
MPLPVSALAYRANAPCEDTLKMFKDTTAGEIMHVTLGPGDLMWLPCRWLFAALTLGDYNYGIR